MEVQTDKIVGEINKDNPGIQVLMLCRFGSHLYGTNTPDSDTDYQGVFLPSKDMVLSGNVPDTIKERKYSSSDNIKNSKDDIDFELHSLKHFIEMACAGEIIAMDMLHVNKENLIVTSDLWEKIQNKRDRFYTSRLEKLVGYARKQAAKYGVKGSRLNVAKELIEMLANQPDSSKKMSTVWDKLPITEYSFYIHDSPDGVKQYSVCDKVIQESVKIGYAQGILLKYYKSYGARAELAAQNKGIDWKAISHALRGGYQVRSILRNKKLEFPLKEAEYLKKVKLGELHYKNDVEPELNGLLEALKLYSKRCSLPESVDTNYWDTFVKNEILKSLTKKVSALDINEISDIYVFALKHGSGKYKTVNVSFKNELVGWSVEVSSNGYSKDVTNIDNW